MLNRKDFEDIVRLLPFYANGTLGTEDCARVDAALAGSAELRAELAAVSDMAQLVKAGGREMTQGIDDSETRLDAVLGRIDELPAQPAPQQPEQGVPAPQGLRSLLGFLHPRRWHPAVSLTLAVAALAQGAIVSGLFSTKQSNESQIAALEKRVGDLEFALASGVDGQQRGNIIITLAADAPWASVETLLGKEALSMVGGPSDGAVTLASPAKGAALDAQISRLRASPLIEAADKVL